MQGRRPRRPAVVRAASLLLVGCVAALGAARDGSPVGGMTPAAAVTQDVTPVADAHVRSDARRTNFGGLSELWADSSPTTRAYLRFQVTGVDSTVSRAQLRVYATAGHATGFQVRKVTSTTWSESSITYSNAPSVSSTVTASSGALTGGSFKTVDVTSLISGNGTYSLALTTTSSSNLVLASRESGANAPRLTVEHGDTTAPETTLTGGPSGSVASTSASFTFSSSEAGSTFQCSLDSTTAYGACSSPKAYTGLAAGSHTFRVRAIDAAGNVDATPATRSWTVQAGDTAAPDTTIDSGPSGTYRSGSADFSLSASESGATFQCRIDGGTFSPCDAAPTFHVANGRHELEVRAVDAAGNADPSPASRSWWADALLQNGNFETPLAGWATQGGGYAVAGWKSSIGALSTVNGGIAGAKAGRVTASAAGSLATNASPWPINSTKAGTVYTAQGSVRSETPGKTVCLRLREYYEGAQVGSAQQCVATMASWRQFATVQYTTARNGSELDFLVYQTTTAAAGDSFDLDGLSLSDGSPAQVAPVPAASGDPVLLAAGDVASCWSSGDESVSRLLDTLPGTIAIPGDTEQNHGYPEEFDGCYDPSWGRHKARTRPAVGDHEYGTAGAAGYFDYFGSSAGPPGKGWYSYDLGTWHIVVLNSNCDAVGGCGPGSEQYQWLQQDLQANAGDCIGAYWHHPRFSAGGTHGNKSNGQPFWELLYQHRAEWVLGGNDHNYQRFAPQTPAGELDRERGIRQFVVGEGGTMHYPLGTPQANTEVQNTGTFGVLKLTLRGSSYDWRFMAQDGKSFTDSGSTACSPLAAADPPDTTIDSGPSGTVESTDASFGFSASKSGTTFECSLDGAAFGPCSSPKAYASLALGEHTFRVRAVDAAAGPDPTPATRTWTIAAPPPPQPNLIVNGSFEDSLGGWYGYKAGLALVAGGADGQRALRVALNAVATSFSVSTSPHPVASPPAGARYEARAWARSATPGRTTCLRIREWQGGSVTGSAQACRAATSTWEQFPSVSYTASGGDSIEVYAYQLNAVTGDSFDLDGATLVTAP
ncbi:MAG TPA: DNRLRE domain-containing protein [Thermoleophilaceae bacterium]|nr:DNRLRE domain-containing protein [Thermoleophilaceae bacterium]